MESVRKNLSKTFQEFDNLNNPTTERSEEDSIGKNKSKQKSKSNLTVISDFVNEGGSKSKYRLKKSTSKKNNSKSKSKIKQSVKNK